MSWEHVLLEKTDRIGTTTLNRPETLNALGITSKSEDFKEGFKSFLEKRESRGSTLRA